MNSTSINSLFEQLSTDKKLDDEVEVGNIEYKLRLDKKDENGIKKLEAQLIWRVYEGKFFTGTAKAYYVIGIRDNGCLGYIDKCVVKSSVSVLCELCDVNKLTVVEIKYYDYGNNSVAIVEIKNFGDPYKKVKEIKIMIVGDSEIGKTTFLGNITHGTSEKLNKTKSRLLVLKHKHEIDSGNSTSIIHEIIGYDEVGNVINYNDNSELNCNNWENIYNKSDMIVNFFDTPGNPKYYKTVYSNYFNINPDIMMIFIENYTAMVHDLYRGLFIDKIIFFVVVSKDYCYEQIDEFTYISNIDNQDYNSIVDISKKIYMISSDLVKSYDNFNTEFRIFEVFNIPLLNKNTIVSGFIESGSITIDDKLSIDDGMEHVRIAHIHKKYIDTNSASAGESVCLELDTCCKINKQSIIHNYYDMYIVVDKIDICIDMHVNITNDNMYVIYDTFSADMMILNMIICDSYIVVQLTSVNKQKINLIRNRNKCFINLLNNGNNTIYVGKIIFS